MYWYISAENPESKDGKFKHGFDGPYESDKEANEMGFKLFPGQMFKKHTYRTHNKAAALQQWKHELGLEKGAWGALKPVRHPSTKFNNSNRKISQG